jgi:hypothetical protein
VIFGVDHLAFEAECPPRVVVDQDRELLLGLGLIAA